jgi:thiamine biosynthesis lipoprotein
MSTSGNTPNNRLKFGAKGHIINPLTGEFQKESKTITVVTNSPIDAEVLSTSLFIAGDSDKAEIISRFNPMEAIEISYNQINEHKIINLNNEFTIIAK